MENCTNKKLILLGKKVAELRAKKGLTQDKLAELTNYSTNHIAKLESARTNPSYELLLNLAGALNVEIKDLFDFKETKEPEYYKRKLISLIDAADSKELPSLYELCRLFLDK